MRMKLIRSFLSGEKGTVTVLLALSMVALAGFAALVTDAGLIYINRIKMHDALDSAVLAAVQELPGNPQEALNVAAAYAQMNGLLAEEYDFELDAENKGIRANGNRKLGLVFARVLGFEEADITVSSRARVVSVNAVQGVVPFGVLEGEYEFGEEILLKEGAGEGYYYGWFGALSLGGTGADIYRENVKYGYNGIIKIGDEVPVETGNMSGPTYEGVNYRINQCHHVPQCSIDSYVKGCPRICIVPLGIPNELPGGNRIFTVTGFAAFLIDDRPGNGTDSEVWGTFIKYVIPGEVDENANDYGLYGARLCE